MSENVPLAVIRPALTDEAQLITELALRSKGYWGYEPAFLAACHDELTITPAYIDDNSVFVLVEQEHIRGFYSLCEKQPDVIELGHLFVAPDAIKKGYGKMLWLHAISVAKKLGFFTLKIESDPFAETFYLAMGAKRIGSVPSLVWPDRVLPLLSFTCDKSE